MVNEETDHILIKYDLILVVMMTQVSYTVCGQSKTVHSAECDFPPTTCSSCNSDCQK